MFANTTQSLRSKYSRANMNMQPQASIVRSLTGRNQPQEEELKAARQANYEKNYQRAE